MGKTELDYLQQVEFLLIHAAMTIQGKALQLNKHLQCLQENEVHKIKLFTSYFKVLFT